MTMYAPDEKLGSRLRSDFSVVAYGPIGDYRVLTGSRGERIVPSTEISSETTDVIVVGGSQTFASGLSADQGFAAQLARHARLNVRNFAVPGFGGVSSLLMINRHLDLNPKYIVYGFWEDHMRRNLARCAAIDSPVCFQFPTLNTEDNTFSINYPEDAEDKISEVRAYYRETARERPFHPLWLDTYWTMKKWYRKFEDQVISKDNSNNKDLQIEGMKWVLGQMAAEAGQKNATLIVVFIPAYFDKINALPTQLKSLEDGSSIILIDMSERFAELRRDNVSFTIPNDGHLNEVGHGVIAESIVETLQANAR